MKEGGPLFSILIPTSGRADLIRMAVRSVLAQSLQDFEIVVADLSGSQEARQAATDSGDKRIRYFHAPSADPLFRWDFAPRQAQGEYLLWLDDDNYLLPFALKTFAKAIARTHADVITAGHLYYYDAEHPRHHLRNAVGVVPWSGQDYQIDLGATLRKIYGFARTGAGRGAPRFHFSATVVARRVVEEVYRRIGFLLFADLPNIHALQPILFSFATSCRFIDWPVAIIGRLGVSMSQSWSLAARERFRREEFGRKLSPLTGHTRINAVLENYLRAQKLLPDKLGRLTIDYARFTDIYLRELLFLDADFRDFFRNWQNLFVFLKTLPQETSRRIRAQARKLAVLALLVWAGRQLGLHRLWRAIRGRFLRATRKIEPREALKRTKEFELPIEARYGVKSIADLAVSLREIVLEKTGKDIWPNSS